MTTAQPLVGHAETWTDPKKYLWPLGLVLPALTFLAPVLASAVGGAGWWLGPLFAFVFVPVVDTLVGGNDANPPDSATEELESTRWYRAIIWAYIPAQYIGLFWAGYVISTRDMSVVDLVGYTLTIGILGGGAINAAHELGHKREKLDRWLSRFALAQSAYGHFYVEHNRGHHRWVSTPEDPASSRLGESFYRFLPRTVIGSFRSAWKLEVTRLTNRKLPVWSRHNDVLVGLAITVVLFGAVIAAFGPIMVPVLIAQAIVGFSLLEIINYIEHYGLLRQKKPSGHYEACQPEHSWNANHVVSNLLLYQLQRHSDHHANPTRGYQTLRNFDDAPQLPAGYAGMILLATMPPLWRRMMDPRVAAHYDGDLTLANIDPKRRSAYLPA